MPIFYLHVYNDLVSIDHEGQDLKDIDAARKLALRECRILAAETVRHGQLNLSHHIDVHDADNAFLFSVLYGEAVRIDE